MTRRCAFFATRQDSLNLLLEVEKGCPLLYVRWGFYPEPEAPTYETATGIPDLGTSRGRKADICYLVLPRGSELCFDKSGLGDTPVTYGPIPPGGDSQYVHFYGGGVYRGECLITSLIQTASESREGLRFYDRFYRALRTRFHRVGSGYRNLVGSDALELLRSGMRFTDGCRSPRRLDFKLPRGWRPAAPVRGRKAAPGT
jgi:hypothetical protein